MPYSPEVLLQLLQRFIKHPNKIKQVHSLLITDGYLLRGLNTQPHSKWMRTLLYNTLIRAHLNAGQTCKTLFLFTHMLANQAPPNSHTFPSLIKAAASSLPSFGRPLHTQVVKRGVLFDPFIPTTFVVFYGEHGSLRDAYKMFEEISLLCIVAYNAMLHASGKNGSVESALLIFERMPDRDIVSWTTVINGFWSNGYFAEAIQFFKKMMAHENIGNGLVKPNEATYVCVLSSCANFAGRGSLDFGKQVHGYILRNEVFLTVFVGTSLIDFYGKMGCLPKAMNVFTQMVPTEVCSWNAMISSLASNGREKEALDMFENMKREGLHPNEVTFVAVLTACARGKFVETGLKVFQSMSLDFGVVPTMEHYGCVVDLLGRAGLLKEATDIVRSMPLQPDASVLGALLGACKIYGSTELGDEVGRRLLELNQRHCSQYVLLSNTNAGVERWDYAAALRKDMVDAGILKIPAYSSVYLA
ncbi:putative Pentatricopeptide repeat-containing protein [Quillaja saponaria]|uniref:Pentatricopeptide repeat-containing protein n=1 Tax=Quillaja saponaria TaxID=32244 RepID=A0AAD7LPE6_QUISA|nr:putative Pentatricopeptide repeat-containing protein [Quillaja saponaria]